MQTLLLLLTIQSVYILAAASPGPNTMLVTRQALLDSRRAGVFTALGVAAGSLVHASMGILGISAVIIRFPLVFDLLKWLGSAYLVYLGGRMLFSKTHRDNNIAGSLTQNRMGAFRSGLLTNLTNPKSYIFYFALFSNLLSIATPGWLKAVIVVQIVSSSVLWHVMLATLFSAAGIRSRFVRVTRWLDKIFGTVLVLLGLRIAFSKL